MKDEMKSKFYKKFHSLIKMKSEKGNTRSLSKNKYKILMQQFNARKCDDPKKEPKAYQFIRQFDNVQIDHVVKLIYPIEMGNTLIKSFLQT